MPAFEGQLGDEEINAVAEYVSSVAGQLTGGGPPRRVEAH